MFLCAVFEIAIAEKDVLLCIVQSPLTITPFFITSNSTFPPPTQNYQFMGPCEYELVRICDGNENFRIHVDFLSDDLSTGRIGLVIGDAGASEDELSKITISENLTLNYSNIDTPTPSRNDARKKTFDKFNITLEEADQSILIQVFEFGVTVFLSRSPDQQSLSVNVTIDKLNNRSLCGLCGDNKGNLVYRDSDEIADIMVDSEVQSFIQSWRVMPDVQFLREKREECGECFARAVCSLVYQPTSASSSLLSEEKVGLFTQTLSLQCKCRHSRKTWSMLTRLNVVPMCLSTLVRMKCACTYTYSMYIYSQIHIMYVYVSILPYIFLQYVLEYTQLIYSM